MKTRLLVVYLVLGCVGLALSLMTGAAGFSPTQFSVDWHSASAQLVLFDIRLPRSLGCALIGALLGLSGAIAQGLFRNPLADPYLLGSSAGAGLGVVLSLAILSHGIEMNTQFEWTVMSAAFVGAWLGVMLTLLLSRHALQTARLLLAGVIVGILLGSVADLITTISPDALRGRQAFMLGNTSLLGWAQLPSLGLGFVICVIAALRYARALDALSLGEDSAQSLGLRLGRVRLILVSALSLGTALCVAQVGMVAFVGLIAPHIVRRHAPGPHAWLLLASSLSGAVLLLLADGLSRALVAPQEVPVGVVTAVLGGGYLLWLMQKKV